MSEEKEQVDQAFLELENDPDDTYILTNLVDELTTHQAVEYFLDRLRPFSSDLCLNDGPQLIKMLLTQWIKNGGDANPIHFKEMSDWVEANIDKMEESVVTYVCLDMVVLFSPNANVFGDQFSDQKMIEYWVGKAMDNASNTDDWVYIIEVIAQPNSGSFLADSEWGRKILELGIKALDKKEAKKLEKKTAGYFS